MKYSVSSTQLPCYGPQMLELDQSCPREIPSSRIVMLWTTDAGTRLIMSSGNP
uniref:Uncharacterized protein n=1 Tax=Arion vulgaris TaxID=1028688 RepID=A0A0B7AEM8_9EUPU